MIVLNDTTGLNYSLEQLGLAVPDSLTNTYIVNVTAAPVLPVFTFIVSFVSFYIATIVFHELGHWYALKKHHPNTQIKLGVWPGEKKVKVWTGNTTQYEQLTPKQQIEVYSAGVGVGLVPIVIFGFVHYAYLALLVPYVMGVLGDVKFILDITKQMKNEEKEQQNEGKTIE